MKFRKPALTLQQLEKYFEDFGAGPAKILPKQKARVRKYAQAALWYLDRGEVTVWDSQTAATRVWLKRAILAFFQTTPATPDRAGCFEYWDKLPVKRRVGLKDVRVVPGAIVRYGAHVEPGVILMPSFVNIGAHVGAGTMVDTWATVGSCAYVGENVHLSGGVGIGGVLEPAQAQPVVIEDGAFLGSRAVVVEGVRVGREAVLGAGVVLTKTTKIIDSRTGEVTSGVVPARAVVVPGTYPKEFGDKTYGLPCALILGQRTESTDLKTSLNNALREYGVAV